MGPAGASARSWIAAPGFLMHIPRMSILTTAKIGAFVCTRDRATAKAFYGETLGLTLIHEDGYATVFDAGGTTLRISPVKELKPQPFTVLGWHVADVAATVKALVAAGVTFKRYDFLTQDELGIWSPGGNIHVAWFKDPDGNLLSLDDS
jgi:catechol 2,3-dioxygenase-like lactoylglutathione lyase family enzyme